MEFLNYNIDLFMAKVENFIELIFSILLLASEINFIQKINNKTNDPNITQ